MSSTIKFGNFSLSVFGESHGAGIGVILDGIPGGEQLDFDKILDFMARRAPKKDGTSTFRSEKDFPEIMSGIVDGTTTGTPICAVIRNTDQRSDDYKSVSHLARPGHADYTGHLRYNGANDLRGGGHFSGRITAPLVFAGAVCGQILEKKGVHSAAHIYCVSNVFDKAFDAVNVSKNELEEVKKRYLPLLDQSKDSDIRAVIESARQNQDSVGGIVECAIIGLEGGIGSPMFDGIENRISQIVFGVPAVKGIEFGIGFKVATLFGSENNDEFYLDKGTIKTKTNNCGGILGGISDSMPIIFRTAIKPTPSISLPQKTVDYVKKSEEILQIKGRHDPCIVPRAVPCIEAAANIAITSLIFQ